MAMPRVFVSFDYDHDDDLRKMFVGQSRHPDSPFELADWSVKEPLSGDWQEKVRRRLRAVHQVAVLCGHFTHAATGVAAEVRIAQEENVPYFLLAARHSGVCTRPTSAQVHDKMYEWTWENLRILIAGGR